MSFIVIACDNQPNFWEEFWNEITQVVLEKDDVNKIIIKFVLFTQIMNHFSWLSQS